MNVVGMIVEYNPFHNGHLWHLTEAKRIASAQFAIGVMSGHFLQRGEPSILDKWSRANMAVQAGVDLVIELPTVFSVRSAQYFATGGIQLLARLGIVSHVCFGTETPDLAGLISVAHALNKKNVIRIMRENMKTGQTYAASLAAALALTTDAASLAQTPNNLLAIEYLRAIETYAPSLQPLPIQRLSANYHDTGINASIASATAVRTTLLKDGILIPGSPAWKAVPPGSAKQINDLVLLGKAPVTLTALSDIILAKIRTMNINEIAALPEVNEGLHNKISAAALQATTAQQLLFQIKSKRYTLTRLQRIIIYALLGITKEKLSAFDQTGPLYIRILAFNDNGRKLLKEIRKQALVPVITKTSQFLTSKQRQHKNLSTLQEMLAYDIAATDIYMLGSPNHQWKAGGQDYHISPQYV
ncbi:nucleotidyltransferase [Sporomusa acidovorans]|uniref:tRNA(Met) cytidine acetate ligase n=1 Tax=Sporomusa acidovorans (strain ATCC 49682 / DSM 3132 / Mol) TaxID=1123286 RepID=A0ABZ3J291_SPOA4|nr:nucleotidyltransferase [Sporomusa acidovorans]OZC19996.1 hypothetical protein SPACI_23940 [Sporomusa acidovorans DSM 3132]SDD48045.1 Predicted nucleotidyltransferase [Sporomusa acidovorans]